MTLQAATAIEGGALLGVLVELQNLKITVVAGAAADTDIAVAGIKAEDTVKSILRLDRDASAATINIVDETADLKTGFPDDNGDIQLETTNSTGDTLIVFWYDKNP